MAFRRWTPENKLLALVAAALVSLALQRQPEPRIVIDGAFDDWTAVAVGTNDPADARSSPVDIAAVRVAAEPRFLSVLISFRRAVTIAGLSGSLLILIDEDGVRSTGGDVHGIAGVDLEISPGRRGGERVRRISGSTRAADGERPSAIGLDLAPRWRSDRVEFRIERGRQPGAAPVPLLIGPRAAVSVVYVEEGRVIDATAAIAVELPPFEPRRTPAADERTPLTDPLTRAPAAAIRVVVWNVFGRQSGKPWHEVTSTLRALDADVLLLNEVTSTSAARVVAWLPPSGRSDVPAWGVSLNGEVATAVRGGLEPIFAEPPRRRARTLYDTLRAMTFRRPRVSAAGAVATIDRRRILVVPLHFSCCGAMLERAEESRTLHSAIARELPLVRPDAVLVGGDFNTVGDLEPVEVLQRGTDIDGSPLAIVPARQLDGLSAMTWRPLSASARFAPGRLDWLLYSGSSLELLDAFVFDASDLSPYWLTYYGLSGDASLRTSDHLPVVADFKWRR